MDSPMEFWGVEVKVGQTVEVDPMNEENAYIHISQVALGEAKEKANEPVVIYVKVDNQKIVLGTLNRDNTPHLSLDLVLHSESELSHTSKSASVFFCGYKVLAEDDDDSEFSDIDEDEDLPIHGLDNGIAEIKVEGEKVTKPSKPVPVVGASAKQAKGLVSKKEEAGESDNESDDDTAEDDSGSSDEIDGSDSDEESESDEETPVKKGNKRPNDSAPKSPVSAKKAKSATPEKTDGKKIVHVATPYPTKKGGKTPNSAKGQSPKSAGQLSCGSCKKTFSSEVGLQQHNKSKHGDQ